VKAVFKKVYKHKKNNSQKFQKHENIYKYKNFINFNTKYSKKTSQILFKYYQIKYIFLQ